MYIPKTCAPTIVTKDCNRAITLNKTNLPAYISRGVYLVL